MKMHFQIVLIIFLLCHTNVLRRVVCCVCLYICLISICIVCSPSPPCHPQFPGDNHGCEERDHMMSLCVLPKVALALSIILRIGDRVGEASCIFSGSEFSSRISTPAIIVLKCVSIAALWASQSARATALRSCSHVCSVISVVAFSCFELGDKTCAGTNESAV